MATVRKAAEIIEAYPEYAQFAGGVPFEEIWVTEQELEVTFPDSYRDFLLKYGCGTFGGSLVYGLGVPSDTSPSVVWATNLMRDSDDFFPADLVPVQGGAEGDVLCLATSRLDEDKECPVVQWIPEMSFEEQAFEVVHKTFAHFLLRLTKLEVGIK